MVQVIMGLRGSGKTKLLIEMVTKTARTGTGHVIVIERGKKLESEIHAREARLIDTKDYGVRSYQVLRGFITGLYAGNYDTTHIFIDSLLKIVECNDMAEAERFLDWLARFGAENSITFAVTVSADAQTASEKIKSYFM